MYKSWNQKLLNVNKSLTESKLDECNKGTLENLYQTFSQISLVEIRE